jgi:hypothetical protein
MKTISRTILALGLAMTMAGGALAQGLDPSGVWVAEKNSDYEVKMCGPDSDRLCVRLVGLRNKMDKPRNREYLNKTIIDGAKPDGTNRWKGKMSVYGHTGDVWVNMKSDGALHVKLCAYVVICDEYDMTRK